MSFSTSAGIRRPGGLADFASNRGRDGREVPRPRGPVWPCPAHERAGALARVAWAGFAGPTLPRLVSHDLQ
jgi:hypothetical protein